ncbi:unnamed protein product [Dovyalis caffra]|uniref:Uncharacterized protein n=1 Tax=Dovyalis caffra TaxID=77055 RepID=A0AAV1SA56_9ROSI|nr:unnamed protein product [Dovyalis caffra]
MKCMLGEDPQEHLRRKPQTDMMGPESLNSLVRRMDCERMFSHMGHEIFDPLPVTVTISRTQ